MDFWELFLNQGCFISLPHGEIWVGAGFATQSRQANDKPGELTFYKNSFFLDAPTPWITPRAHRTVSRAELAQALASFAKAPAYAWEPAGRPDRLLYKTQFELLQQHLTQQMLTKGVPFSHQYCPTTPTPAERAFLVRALCQAAHTDNLYAYGFWDQDTHTGCVGASPELIFHYQNQELFTYALAGTLWGSDRDVVDPHTLPQWPTLLAEHTAVSTSLYADLSPLGAVQQGPIVLWRLKTLSHLRSDLRVACVQPPSFDQVVELLHPTPALGAFPKQAGWEWLRAIEQDITPRFDYGCPLGLQETGRSALCIGAIRGLFWQKDALHITAGGGVVAGSQEETEWAEIKQKINAIKDSFGLPR